MKSSFVTWQLRQLHAELEAIDRRPKERTWLGYKLAFDVDEPTGKRASAARAVLLDRFLRALPARLGFPNARSFASAFARANHLLTGGSYPRRRITARELSDVDRRLLDGESPAAIARALGCTEQIVLDRGAALTGRKSAEQQTDAAGI